MDQYIGKLLDNRYEILELIGVGGMARVYKARCHRLNRLVAIKILREDLARDAEFRRRFHDESQAVAMLSHPNIVAVYDVSHSDNLDYIVMELIDGITLKQYMESRGNKLPWREALHFITQITKALGHAHSRGIIHRDIKPHNIMVLRDGSVKVADFGIARLMTAEHSTLTQEALGSVHYISPEQAKGSNIDARSDLYSAGVVLYEMLTGRLPFEGDTPVSVAIQHINSIPLSPRELNPDIPEALESITMKAMAPNPDNRYRSADEMLADLEAFRKNPDISFDYEPFTVDIADFSDEPTQIVHADRVNSTIRKTRGQNQRHGYDADEDKNEEDEPVRRRDSSRQSGDARKRSMVIGISAVVVVVLAVFAVLWVTVFSGMFQGNDNAPRVPNLIGKTMADLELDDSILDGFTVRDGGSMPSDKPEGTIIDQTPSAGTKITGTSDEDMVITIITSSGSEPIHMIDVTNREYREATIELEKLGLTVDTPEFQNSDEIPENYVISYTPVKDTEMKEGDTVHLVVSSGPEDTPITVPSLAGMTLDRATSDLQAMGLEVGEVKKVHDSSVPEGVVMDQYPTTGTSVAAGTKINLQVSLGPAPATDTTEPSQNPETVTKTLSVTLPSGDGTVHVVITQSAKTVYDHTVERSQGSVSVSLTGSGTEEIEIYFDGTLSESYPFNFS